MSSHREILRIALPGIATNITIPLLGLADVAIVGHIGGDRATVCIGAISVGGMIFNMVYWLFGFLRMGTSGLTAQAYGRGDTEGQLRVLVQAATVALVGSAAFLLLQWPIAEVAKLIIAPTPEVWTAAVTYFRVRVWAAPAVLLLFAINGWFIGMQDSRTPLVVAIGQNVVNIMASVICVFALHWDVAGVAAGTVVAQYAGLAAAWLIWRRRYGKAFPKPLPEGRGFLRRKHFSCSLPFRGGSGRGREAAGWSRFFSVNGDIFLRTLCLIAVTCAFTAIGAREGDLCLAVNALLIQLFTLFSYFVDGFALAGEALTGRYIGAGDRRMTRRSVCRIFAWGGGIALVFTLAYMTLGPSFLVLLTDDTVVRHAATAYLPWAVAIPLASFAAFVWDGIFIGATATRPMLYTLIVATAVFFLLYAFLPTAGWEPNARLWAAFIGYLATRSLVQSAFAPRALSRPR